MLFIVCSEQSWTKLSWITKILQVHCDWIFLNVLMIWDLLLLSHISGDIVKFESSKSVWTKQVSLVITSLSVVMSVDLFMQWNFIMLFRFEMDIFRSIYGVNENCFQQFCSICCKLSSQKRARTSIVLCLSRQEATNTLYLICSLFLAWLGKPWDVT